MRQPLACPNVAPQCKLQAGLVIVLLAITAVAGEQFVSESAAASAASSAPPPPQAPLAAAVTELAAAEPTQPQAQPQAQAQPPIAAPAAAPQAAQAAGPLPEQVGAAGAGPRASASPEPADDDEGDGAEPQPGQQLAGPGPGPQQSRASQMQFAHHKQQAQQQPQEAPKLPKINIYISKNEIKKLLGLEKRIDYVTNGHINTYPLGFTIPMGYNQSDIIFTWQNLGPTNVNYSISLLIGNPKAVATPLINITRNGLIPHHEQVFKITLPCSGRLTDEVDVQVLISIVGAVAAPSGADEPAPAPAQADLQAAIASRQRDLERPRPGPGAGLGPQNATAEWNMQADEPVTQPAQAPMRLVTHQLAIKRKKICTMHPVPILPAKVRPPNQARPAPQQPAAASTQPAAQASAAPGPAEPPAELPAHHPGLAAPPASLLVGLQRAPAADPAPTPTQPAPGPAAGWQARTAPTLAPENPLGELLLRAQLHQQHIHHQHQHQHHQLQLHHQQQQQQHQQPIQQQQQPAHQQHLATANSSRLAAGPAGASGPAAGGPNPLLLTLMLMSAVVSVALVALLLLSSASAHQFAGSRLRYARRRKPLDKLGSLTSRLLRRGQPRSQGRARHHQPPQAPTKSSATLGAQRRLADQQPAHLLQKNASAHHEQLGPAKWAAPGPKWALGPHLAAYGAQCAPPGYYSTLAGPGSGAAAGQHRYQAQPQPNQAANQQSSIQDLLDSASYLGPLAAAPAGQPIYQLAAANGSQTTRLIWSQSSATASSEGANGAAFTLDAGSYLPLAPSGAANSSADSATGSLYQTIY